MKRAGDFYRRVPEIYERARNILTAFLADKGDLAEAEPLFRRNPENQERLLGAENPQTCLAAFNLADFLRRHLPPKPETARLALQAYRGWLKAGGAKNADTLHARHLLQQLDEQVPK